MTFNPSRNHWTDAPPIKTDPSRAYVVFPFNFQATVVNNPFFDKIGFSPIFISIKQPVPYVFFDWPDSKQQ